MLKMISPEHFGMRLATFRKGAGITQVRLAEILGETRQTVSEIECGRKMPTVDQLMLMAKHYGASVNELLDDRDVFYGIASRPYKYDRIAYFGVRSETRSPIWAKRVVESGAVSQSWEDSLADNSIYDDIGRRIAEHGGLILEIGTGTDGGFMPYVLKEKPNADIIISDRYPTVVSEWRKLLSFVPLSQNINYAVFDFTDIPFSDKSIDVISDGGGIDNISFGKKEKALREVYRVLKPGGLFVSAVTFITNKEYCIPQQRTALAEKCPELVSDLLEETKRQGFKEIEDEVISSWDSYADEETVDDYSFLYGLKLNYTRYVRYCRK